MKAERGVGGFVEKFREKRRVRQLEQMYGRAGNKLDSLDMVRDGFILELGRFCLRLVVQEDEVRKLILEALTKPGCWSALYARL